MPCSAAMYSIMWKPKYFQTITISTATIAVWVLAEQMRRLGAEPVPDRRDEAIVAVIDEAENQAGRDLGQDIRQEEQHA